MVQYCRYCSWFVTGNGNWCEKKHTEPSDRYAKSPNRCKDYDLNPIDAFGENPKGYQPREPREPRTKVGEQIREPRTKVGEQIRMEGIR